MAARAVPSGTRGTSYNRQEITINLAGKPSPMFVSVRIRIDTEVPPGLYDDFVFVRLSNQSPDITFVASLGFLA